MTQADSPAGKQLVTAMRAEAQLFERDGKAQAAGRLRAQADKLDWLEGVQRGSHGHGTSQS